MRSGFSVTACGIGYLKQLSNKSGQLFRPLPYKPRKNLIKPTIRVDVPFYCPFDVQKIQQYPPITLYIPRQSL